MLRYCAGLLGCMVLVFAITANGAQAQLGDLLKSPKTLIDRAIEARSSDDIVTDNEIVLDVNAIMADLGTIKASTEIYEQRLLVTGIFDDEKLYNEFRHRVEQVGKVKELLWHVVYISADEQVARSNEILGWSDVLILDTRAEAEMIGTRGVADVNFRIAVDALSTAYLLGRARSAEERSKAAQTLREVSGISKIVDYSVVRP